MLKTENKLKKVDNFITSLLKTDLSKFIVDKYGKENYEGYNKAILFIKILNSSGEHNLEEKLRFFLKNKLNKMTINKDSRNYLEYGFDLILGWVVEDAIFEYFNDKCKIQYHSKDKKREFLDEPSSCSDFKVGDSHLEIIQDNTGYWRRSFKLHLRGNKLQTLKGYKKSYLLGIDLNNNSFIFLDIHKCNSQYIESHKAYGGKPVWEILLNQTEVFPINNER